MKRILTLTLAVCLYAVSALASIEGAWTASTDEKRPDRIYISITRGRNHQMGTTMQISDFTSLTRARIDAAATTPVQFQLRREAGNTSFEGTFRNGKGAGQLTFTSNPGYLDSIRALGVKIELKRGASVDEEDLFMLALQDVSTAFIKSMQAEGFRESLEKYLEMRIFDITPEYIHQMRDLGYAHVPADDLVAMRIHRVTPEFIRELRAAGYTKVPVEKLVEMRIHKIDAKYLQKMGGDS